MTPVTITLALLWVVVICLSVAVLALARQVGVLHERVSPAGALISAAGPGVGPHPAPAVCVSCRGRSHLRGAGNRPRV